MLCFIQNIVYFFLLSISSYTYAQTAVIINEIMANPNNGQLPKYEYIELFNNGNEAALLEEYKITIGNNVINLPVYQLPPQQFVLLCSNTALSQFVPFGQALALSRWPALSNTGTTLSLIRGDQVVDQVTYSDRWYGSTAKKNGGWSLERINPNLSCNISLNWTASTHTLGGTPCETNSVHDTYRIPQISINTTQIKDNRLALSWNIPIENFDFRIEHFEVLPRLGTPDRLEISTAKDSLYLYFDQSFEMNTIYTLKIKDIQWCLQDITIADIELFQQGDIAYNDIVINEVLFNPKADGVDFVEVLNRSDYPINLQNWKLGTRMISKDKLFLHPGQHLALTTNPSILYSQYQTHKDQFIYAMASLPAYANQQGVVTLFSPEKMIDSLYYNADMHQPFLKNQKGISLERQWPDSPTNTVGNFHSASTLSGGATPGYQNSTQNDFISKKNKFFLSSKTVSPDQDGFEDFLEINYELDASDYMMNIQIFSESGRLINRLIRQQSAGFSGKVTWDCRTESGSLAPAGIYIFTVEIYNEKGHRELQKGGFVVTHHAHSY